jgi:hypothetical protein
LTLLSKNEKIKVNDSPLIFLIKVNMKTAIIGTIFSLFTAVNAYAVNYQGDLISRNKSDSAIKFLKPPLSLAVLQNRPEKGFYYFFSNKKPKYDEALGGAPKDNDAFDIIISDTKIIKKTLRSIDPARLAPASLGADIRGVVDRNQLKELIKTIPSDILLVYRREILVKSAREFPDSYFQNPELFLNLATADFTIEISTKGLVYISKQKKVLALPYNKQSVSISKGQNDIGHLLVNAVKNGLKTLANEAKNKIRAQKKIITKSY